MGFASVGMSDIPLTAISILTITCMFYITKAHAIIYLQWAQSKGSEKTGRMVKLLKVFDDALATLC